MNFKDPKGTLKIDNAKNKIIKQNYCLFFIYTPNSFIERLSLF